MNPEDVKLLSLPDISPISCESKRPLTGRESIFPPDMLCSPVLTRAIPLNTFDSIRLPNPCRTLN
jgi:hypothetical protein